MTNEDIRAALKGAEPVPIELTEKEEAKVIEAVFGGDRTVAEDLKSQATILFQEALDRRLHQILDEARVLLEQREEQLADLQHIALELLKDKIIERMTPRLSLLQRERLKSHSLSWDIDLNCADPFGEFGLKVERYANDLFPRRVVSSSSFDEPSGIDEYVIEAADPSVEQAVHFSHWLGGK